MRITRDRICLYTPSHPSRRTTADVIRCAAELGLGGVELRSFCEELRTADRNEAKVFGALARSLGLKLPCFSVASDLVGKAESDMPRLQRYAEICYELEIPYLHHTVAFDMHAFSLSEEEREERFQRCLAPTLAICEYAERLGVRTLIEDQGFVFNGREACERLCALSGDRIGIVADVGNTFFVDEHPEDFIRVMGGRVCHAHIKDFRITDEPTEGYKYRSRGGAYLSDIEIGTGAVDLSAIKKAFADISYEGMFALEFARIADEDEAERVIERLTN